MQVPALRLSCKKGGHAASLPERARQASCPASLALRGFLCEGAECEGAGKGTFIKKEGLKN